VPIEWDCLPILSGQVEESLNDGTQDETVDRTEDETVNRTDSCGTNKTNIKTERNYGFFFEKK